MAHLAAGKHSFAILHVRYCPHSTKDIYIATENTFLPERIESIAKTSGVDPKNILQNIQVAKPMESSQQEPCLETGSYITSKRIQK